MREGQRSHEDGVAGRDDRRRHADPEASGEDRRHAERQTSTQRADTDAHVAAEVAPPLGTLGAVVDALVDARHFLHDPIGAPEFRFRRALCVGERHAAGHVVAHAHLDVEAHFGRSVRAAIALEEVDLSYPGVHTGCSVASRILPTASTNCFQLPDSARSWAFPFAVRR